MRGGALGPGTLPGGGGWVGGRQGGPGAQCAPTPPPTPMGTTPFLASVSPLTFYILGVGELSPFLDLFIF